MDLDKTKVKAGIGLGITIALPNYQNIKPYVYLEMVIGSGEPMDEMDNLYNTAEAELEVVIEKLLDYATTLLEVT